MSAGSMTYAQAKQTENLKPVFMTYDSLKGIVQKIEGLSLTERSWIRYIKFQEGISTKSIQALLELLRKNAIDFEFYDERYPILSEESDPGAYVSYSQKKNTLDKVWNMTMGNHHWSGGIYQIDESTVAIQLKDLIDRKLISEIKIDRVAFFDHYEMRGPEKSKEENKKIAEKHSPKAK